MLLALDVGNSQITAGLADRERWIGHFRCATALHKTEDEYGLLLTTMVQRLAGAAPSSRWVDGAVVGSVVPVLVPVLQATCRRYLGVDPLVVRHDTPTGLQIGYDRPEELGVDRIADAVGAFRRWGGPVVIVDCGTATTVDAVDAGGRFLGGAIMPGLSISMDGLFGRAAKLPRFDWAAPLRAGGAVGKNTVQAMHTGLTHGYAGGVDALVDRIRAEMTAPAAPVISTGGLGELIGRYSRTIQRHEPHLTLDGLRWIYLHARGQERPNP